MDIVIIAQYLGDLEQIEQSTSRFIYLAKLLVDNHNVEIVTSSFSHRAKKQIEAPKEYREIKLTSLYEPGYRKNVCVQRFISHKKLSDNVKNYLESRKKPDVIYLAVPSLSVGDVVADYCQRNQVRFIVDIQDLWPEAFRMVFNVPLLSNLVFKPMEKQADRIYAAADEVVAVSRTYVERGMSVNKKCKQGHAIFLGRDIKTFDSNSLMPCFIEKRDDERLLAYCGTLGSSYNLTVVFDALHILKQNGKSVPKFLVMGDGPRRCEFEDYAKKMHLNVEFTGRLPYDSMCAVLKKCDIVINPITKGAAQSIINKHADYAASGLPVINTQESKEYRELVELYQMGFNCDNDDVAGIAEKIQLLCDDDELRAKMGNNARKCAEERFDRRNSYMKLIEIIEDNEAYV